MASLLRKVGHWELTHAELHDNGKLVDEMFTIVHPTREPEYFKSRPQAEARFRELTAAE